MWWSPLPVVCCPTQVGPLPGGRLLITGDVGLAARCIWTAHSAESCTCSSLPPARPNLLWAHKGLLSPGVCKQGKARACHPAPAASYAGQMHLTCASAGVVHRDEGSMPASARGSEAYLATDSPTASSFSRLEQPASNPVRASFARTLACHPA